MRCKTLNNIYLEDIGRAILNMGFMMGALGLTVMLMRTVWYFADVSGGATVMEICSYPMALSGFTVFSAAFPAWGYASQFYKEDKCGYSYFIAARMSWKQYSIMRIVSVSISGGLVIAVPLMILFTFAYTVGNREIGELFQGMYVRDTIINLGIPAVLLIKTCLGALFGVFWSLVGFLSSMLVKNRYAPFLIPFILNQFFWIAFAKYPKLNPIYLVRGEDLDSYGLSATILIIYCVLVASVIMLIFKRRRIH